MKHAQKTKILRTVLRTRVLPFVKRFLKRSLRSFLLSTALHVGTRLLIIVLLIASICYGVYAFVTPMLRNNVVVSQSEIVSRVSKIAAIPSGETVEAVVRVEDAEMLKKQNDFYRSTAVKEGDYILIYPSMALIYDLRNNAVIAIKKK